MHGLGVASARCLAFKGGHAWCSSDQEHIAATKREAPIIARRVA